MENFNQYQEIPNKYLGSDRKRTILINGEEYLLKFPDPIRDKRHMVSYINNALSEYVGCHIYESIGIPVQDTKLGIYQEQNGKVKIACACKDFCKDGTELYEVKAFILSNTEFDKDFKGDIFYTLNTIRKLPIGNQLEMHFWDMFVVDALICNTDRHDGNWGVLLNKKLNEMSIAPVYDCGSSLVPLLDDEELTYKMAKNYSINSRSAGTINGKRVCFSEYILSMENPCLNDAIERIVPKIDIKKINSIIDKVECVSEKRKTFYKDLIKFSYELVLQPTYKKVVGQEKEVNKASVLKQLQENKEKISKGEVGSSKHIGKQISEAERADR